MSEPLAHRHYDTFELPGRLFPDRLAISFFADREGNIASLAATFEPLVQDIVFTRIPAGYSTNPAFRQRCTGAFISQGITTVVVGQDDDGQLTLAVGSQPTYKLRPYQSRTFVIEELERFRVEFQIGPNGQSGCVLHCRVGACPFSENRHPPSLPQGHAFPGNVLKPDEVGHRPLLSRFRLAPSAILPGPSPPRATVRWDHIAAVGSVKSMGVAVVGGWHPRLFG